MPARSRRRQEDPPASAAQDKASESRRSARPRARAAKRGRPARESPLPKPSQGLEETVPASNVSAEHAVAAASRRKSARTCGKLTASTEIVVVSTDADAGSPERLASVGELPDDLGAFVEEGVAFKLGTLGRTYERRKWESGFDVVAGVDEAGRGPLAGPVVAAACVIPPSVLIRGVHDSKKLSETQREHLFSRLVKHRQIKHGIGICDHKEIDDINILQASMKAMEKAVAGLEHKPHYVFVDGNRVPKGLHESHPSAVEAVIKGDSKCYSIAAASVIAKVTRDRLLVELDKKHPEYGFKQHKGYGTAAHVKAIWDHGPSPVHRRTFQPLKNWFPIDSDSEDGGKSSSALELGKGKGKKAKTGSAVRKTGSTVRKTGTKCTRSPRAGSTSQAKPVSSKRTAEKRPRPAAAGAGGPILAADSAPKSDEDSPLTPRARRALARRSRASIQLERDLKEARNHLAHRTPPGTVVVAADAAIVLASSKAAERGKAGSAAKIPLKKAQLSAKSLASSIKLKPSSAAGKKTKLPSRSTAGRRVSKRARDTSSTDA